MRIASHFAALLLSVLAGLMANSAVNAQQSSGPTFWQDVRSGMSEAELRAIHPSILLSEQGSLVQNGVAVAGMTNTYFKMSAGRVQVKLSGDQIAVERMRKFFHNNNSPALVCPTDGKAGA